MTDQPAPVPTGEDIFDAVFAVIESRKSTPPEQSYVSSLFAKGAPKINAKILEEAREVTEAGLAEDKAHLTCEICDLFFHTFVLAAHKGIPLSDIRAELLRRFGTSGHVEKARRNPK